MVPIKCDPLDVQAVKDALNQNSLYGGVGIFHEPSRRIYLVPFDDLPNRGGHTELAKVVNVPQSECKGFAIGKTNGGFLPVNISELNGPQGQPGSLQMPQPVFDEIVQALHDAGL
jgi:hypothetical protein